MHILSKSQQKAKVMKPRGRRAEESRSMKQFENFSPKGLKVLVVDDDPLCLIVLERMLRQCDYNVTTCNRVSEAVSLVMENKDRFDVVMTDVYMPGEDGFKLLEIIGLNLDLPVIMMSGNGETNMVMKGVTHGACDFLIKPVRMEELRNIWQHVVRRRGRDSLREEFEESDHDGKVVDSSESTSKKRKDSINLEQSDEIVEDISSLKKSRVQWTVQLHKQFVAAVNHLGIDKAIPKKILEVMGVHGLTRENVASHLQKYRLYLKRLSGTIPEPYPVASFQAAESGKSGGTMQIKPGGKSVASSIGLIKGLNLGIGASPDTGFGMGPIDQGTLKSLEQYRAYELKRAANRAQVLGGIGILPSKKSNLGQLPDTKGGLQRMSSVDLSLIWKAHRDQRSNQNSGTEASDDIASQSSRNLVKLENAQSKPISAQHILNRHSNSRHSRAQSMSSVLIDFHPTLPLPACQNPKPAKTVLKDISELKSPESISWVETTNSKDGKAGTDASVDLFDDLVDEYGICTLSSPTSSDIEAMSGTVIENEDMLKTAPAGISDFQIDDFLQQ